MSMDLIAQIPREKLKPGPWQPRTKFDETDLQELAGSITEIGITNPLQVVTNGDHGYYIVSGERRYRAAALAGLEELPCIVLDMDDQQDAQMRRRAIVENMHRQDLTPLDEARALEQLAQAGLSQRDIGRELGKSQAWVSQRLGLLKLPEMALDKDGLALRKEISKTMSYGAQPIEGIPARVKALLDHQSRQGDFRKRVDDLRKAGKTVVEDWKGYGDNRYARIYADFGAEIHDADGLTCEAIAVYWDYNGLCEARLCTAVAWQKAREEATATGQKSRWELQREDERRRRDLRDEAKNGIVRDWLAQAPAPRLADASMAIRADLMDDLRYGDWEPVRVCQWLGLGGDGIEGCHKRLFQHLELASDEEALRIWFLLSLANHLENSPIPSPVMEWLQSRGYQDPCPDAEPEVDPEECDGQCYTCSRRETCEDREDEEPAAAPPTGILEPPNCGELQGLCPECDRECNSRQDPPAILTLDFTGPAVDMVYSALAVVGSITLEHGIKPYLQAMIQRDDPGPVMLVCRTCHISKGGLTPVEAHMDLSQHLNHDIELAVTPPLPLPEAEPAPAGPKRKRGKAEAAV